MKHIFLLLFFFAPYFAFSQQLKAMSEKKLLLLYPQPKPITQFLVTIPATKFKADLSAKAFFCRLEDQYNRKKALPFKFRLGDVQAVEQMEHRDEEWRMKN